MVEHGQLRVVVHVGGLLRLGGVRGVVCGCRHDAGRLCDGALLLWRVQLLLWRVLRVELLGLLVLLVLELLRAWLPAGARQGIGRALGSGRVVGGRSLLDVAVQGPQGLPPLEQKRVRGRHEHLDRRQVAGHAAYDDVVGSGGTLLVGDIGLIEKTPCSVVELVLNQVVVKVSVQQLARVLREGVRHHVVGDLQVRFVHAEPSFCDFMLKLAKNR